jgi:protein tyrosine phosphatase (PTP) superfamily phosphohydrolase (DUF442 family)
MATQRRQAGTLGGADLQTRDGHPRMRLRYRTIDEIRRILEFAGAPAVDDGAIASPALLTGSTRDRWRTMIVGVVAVTVGVLVLGNAAIFAASGVAHMTVGQDAERRAIPGIENLRVVDDHVWRGGSPSDEGYRALAALGVTTVVDLRSESDASDDALLHSLGITLVRVPVGDGRAPTGAEADKALAAIDESKGRVFVHCSAGVGRTGSVVAVYLVSNGAADRLGALARNLAVGPPSLEQIVFVLSARNGIVNQPNDAVVALSRFLDAPRLLWNRLT